MSQAQPPSGPVRNLPIWDTVTGSYTSVFSTHVRDLPRAAAVPYVLSTIIALIQVWMTPATSAAAAEHGSGPLVIFSLFGLLPYTLFGVAWYRLVLLDEAPQIVPRWTGHHWRFLGYAVGFILIICGLVFTVVVTFQVIGAFFIDQRDSASAILVTSFAVILAMLLVPIVMLRLSFAFPAVSIGERYGFGASWRQTRKQSFRLLFAVILTYIPLLVGLSVVSAILRLIIPAATISPEHEALQGWSFDNLVIWAFASGLMGYVSLALTLSFVAKAFRTCSGWVPGPPSAPLSAQPFSGSNHET